MKLLHLYHDLMNLYGDYANVSAMERILKKSGESVQTDRLSLADNACLEDYDFIFIGSGTERNQKVALENIKRYSDSLKAYIESGKVLLMTGNSFEMTGDSITDASGKVFDGLSFFGFSVEEQNKTRVTADVIYTCDFLERPLVGFVNKCGEIKGVSDPLFKVKMGLGNCEGDGYEGIGKNNFFGTHLTGPVLIKNPHFLVFLAGIILGRQPEADYLTYEQAGYEITLSELSKRAGAKT